MNKMSFEHHMILHEKSQWRAFENWVKVKAKQFGDAEKILVDNVEINYVNDLIEQRRMMNKEFNPMINKTDIKEKKKYFIRTGKKKNASNEENSDLMEYIRNEIYRKPEWPNYMDAHKEFQLIDDSNC
jgi:hypothetical protein